MDPELNIEGRHVFQRHDGKIYPVNPVNETHGDLFDLDSQNLTVGVRMN